MANETKSPIEHSANSDEVVFTPGQFEALSATLVDTVVTVDVKPSQEEIDNGVLAVKCVSVIPYRVTERSEAYKNLTPGFRGAILRLRECDESKDTTVEIQTESYHGDPVSEGTHSSERLEKVIVLDSDGRVVEGYNQVTKEHGNKEHPRPEGYLEVIKGAPIVGEELLEYAKTVVKDINVCVGAGN